MNYEWNLKCPKCGKRDSCITINREPAPHLNCGECLMKKAEVVELKVMGLVITEGENHSCG